MSLLEADRINSYYGDSHILFDVSMRVEANEVVALLGRNGAGKSTTLKSLMGMVETKSGAIRLDDQDVTRMEPHKLARRGVQLVPEERRIFGSVTVHENLVLAAMTAENPQSFEAIYQKFPRLDERRRLLIVIVEQNVLAALSLAHRCYILNNGHVVYDGTPDGLRKERDIVEKYLGVKT